MKMQITGSLIQAYIYCPRKAWLMSRQIVGDQYNEFLAIGRLISGETYKRDKREILIEGGKIDVVRVKGNEFILIETKKTSKFIETSKKQLIFYLIQMEKNGFKVNGEIRIPKEKKVIPVKLSDSDRSDMEKIKKELSELLASSNPPVKKWSRKCRNCSYLELCWG